MPSFYPEGNQSLVGDDEMRSLHKLVDLLGGGAMPGGGSGGMVHSTVGHGAPEGVVTGNPGDHYLDLDLQARWVKATGTGNTGWV